MAITLTITADTLDEAVAMIIGKKPRENYMEVSDFQPTKTEPAVVPHPVAATTGESPYVAPVQQPEPPTTRFPVRATPPVSPAPTAPKVYTQDELMRATAALMDAGKALELQQMLSTFGVTRFGEIPVGRYGELATALRSLGAKL